MNKFVYLFANILFLMLFMFLTYLYIKWNVFYMAAITICGCGFCLIDIFKK